MIASSPATHRALSCAVAKPRILAFDCGLKFNIVRYLARRGVELTVVPFDFEVSDAMAGE